MTIAIGFHCDYPNKCGRHNYVVRVWWNNLRNEQISPRRYQTGGRACPNSFCASVNQFWKLCCFCYAQMLISRPKMVIWWGIRPLKEAYYSRSRATLNVCPSRSVTFFLWFPMGLFENVSKIESWDNGLPESSHQRVHRNELFRWYD